MRLSYNHIVSEAFFSSQASSFDARHGMGTPIDDRPDYLVPGEPDQVEPDDWLEQHGGKGGKGNSRRLGGGFVRVGVAVVCGD